MGKFTYQQYQANAMHMRDVNGQPIDPIDPLSLPETGSYGAFQGGALQGSTGPMSISDQNKRSVADMQAFLNTMGGATGPMFNQEITRGGKAVREYKVGNGYPTIEPSQMGWTAMLEEARRAVTFEEAWEELRNAKWQIADGPDPLWVTDNLASVLYAGTDRAVMLERFVRSFT